MDILTSVHLGKRLRSQTCMLHFSAKHHIKGHETSKSNTHMLWPPPVLLIEKLGLSGKSTSVPHEKDLQHEDNTGNTLKPCCGACTGRWMSSLVR